MHHGSHTGDARNNACSYAYYNSVSGAECNAARIAAWNASAKTDTSTYLNQAGLSAFMGGDNATGMAAKAAVLAGGAAAHPTQVSVVLQVISIH